MKKQTLIKSLCLLLCVLLLALGAMACDRGSTPQTPPDGTQNEGIWANATHTEDKELGTGSKTITVKITADGRSITLTLHTDKPNLRGALEEHSLVGGDEGPFGLYLETVNGIEVKYENDGYWWGIKKGGVTADTGVDGIEIADGDSYELVKTNQY